MKSVISPLKEIFKLKDGKGKKYDIPESISKFSRKIEKRYKGKEEPSIGKKSATIVYFGERHHIQPILGSQLCVMDQFFGRDTMNPIKKKQQQELSMKQKEDSNLDKQLKDIEEQQMRIQMKMLDNSRRPKDSIDQSVDEDAKLLEELKSNYEKLQSQKKDNDLKFGSKFFNTGQGADKHLVMEMFNVKQQHILREYHYDMITLDQLETLYNSSNTLQSSSSLSSTPKNPGMLTSNHIRFLNEGFSLANHYHLLLDLAKELQVKLQAGFPPRGVANYVMKAGKEEGLKITSDLFPSFPTHMKRIHDIKGSLPEFPFYLEGSEEHFDYFKSLIGSVSGANEDDKKLKVRRLFDAQIFKDSVMAAKIFSIITNSPSDDINIMAITGSGHVDRGFGVPERVRTLCESYDIEVNDLIITSREENEVEQVFPADFVMEYDYENEEETTKEEQ